MKRPLKLLAFWFALIPLAVSAEKLSKEDFLADHEDAEVRDLYWSLFQKAEIEAYRFLPNETDQLKLTRVLPAKKAGVWNTLGELRMEVNLGDKGVMFHELFHPVYHAATLNNGRDQPWSEGFCDAYRFYMEERILGNEPSSWKKNFDQLLKKSDEEIKQRMRKDKFFRTYWGAGILIIKKSNQDYDTFLKMWKELCGKRTKKGPDVLDEFIDFKMTPKPKVEAVAKMPNFYYFEYANPPTPGKRYWLRIDKKTWIERYPDNVTETKFGISGRAVVDGDEGTIARRLDAKGTMTDFEVFIPDRGSKTMHHLFRFSARDANWRSLGEMKGVE